MIKTLGTIHISFRSLRSIAATVLGLGLLILSMAGCSSDLLTYASDSRQQGIKLYNEGNYADAAGSFNNAIRQDPRDYSSYYYLGRSYDGLKQYHQSVQAYRTALDVMKNSQVGSVDTAFRLKVLDGLASAVAKGNSPDLDASALQNRQQPTFEDEFVRAKVARIRGDVDTAVESYHRAGLMEPNNAAVAKESGLYLVQLSQKQAAQNALTRAYVLDVRAGRGEDAEVVAGLRQLGIIPGPSLAEQNDLAQPLVPRGPIPPMKIQNPFVPADEPPTAGVNAGQ